MQWKLSGQPCVMCWLTWGHNHKRNLYCSTFFSLIISLTMITGNGVWKTYIIFWVYNGEEFILTVSSCTQFLGTSGILCWMQDQWGDLFTNWCPLPHNQGLIVGRLGGNTTTGGREACTQKKCQKDKWMLKPIYKLGREIPFIANIPFNNSRKV